MCVCGGDDDDGGGGGGVRGISLTHEWEMGDECMYGWSFVVLRMA